MASNEIYVSAPQTACPLTAALYCTGVCLSVTEVTLCGTSREKLTLNIPQQFVTRDLFTPLASCRAEQSLKGFSK